MMRRRIVEAINRLDPDYDDTGEMVHLLSANYDRRAIDEIIEGQDPALIVVEGRIFVCILDAHPQRWVRVAERVGREVKWSGRLFHDLLIELELNASELDEILDNIIITWKPLV